MATNTHVGLAVSRSNTSSSQERNNDKVLMASSLKEGNAPLPAVSIATTTATKVTTKASTAVHFFAGGFGGAMGALVTCPLEVVKTRLQSSQYARASSTSSLRSQFGGAFETMAEIYRSEGLKALWKGLGPNLVGIIPSRAIYFSTYSKSKEVFTNLNNGREEALVHLSAAATAGVTVATVTCPLWMIKTRMQLQKSGNVRYTSSFDCVKQVVKNEGFWALYRGLGASYLGVFEGSIQFVLYEQLKTWRAKQLKASGNVEGIRTGWFDLFGMAAVSKLIAALVTYPHEVLRTRMREPTPNNIPKYQTIRQSVVLIWREEGARAFYSGMGAHLMRVVPNAAIMFLGYEAIVQYFS